MSNLSIHLTCSPIAERAQINTAEEEETKVLSLKRAAVELKPHLTFYYQNLKRAAEWALRLNWSRHYRGLILKLGWSGSLQFTSTKYSVQM